ncbi:hypothetical protein K491DRAFT_681757 [Lophiostoma macrostomum CBS 122681]|uniref:Pali-domain-containing protein n=1 Tax=Lophiostoma macrostomum CBS 122681 TaxID=1314788 RepID=A0A6A6SWA1_9PLEO|nr:hypothetical protein K491DRAFT_681757 [Lophiostoma macrostomum CBS 122681]
MASYRWDKHPEYPHDNESTTYLDPEFSSYQYTMELPRHQPVLTCLTYLLLTIALISSIVLFCGCIPSSNGHSSVLNTIYATQIQVPGDTVNAIKVCSFALCADYEGTISCSMTQGRNVSELSTLLYTSQASNTSQEHAVGVALNLQHKVFYGTPVLSSITILLTLLCTALSHFILDAKTKLAAAGLAFFSAAILLVDGFATQLALSSLQVSQSSLPGALLFEKGIYYIVLQWLAFTCMLFSGMTLFWRASIRGEDVQMLDAEKAAAAANGGGPVLEPMMPPNFGQRYVYPEQPAHPRIVERVDDREPGVGYQRVVQPMQMPMPMPGGLAPGQLLMVYGKECEKRG